MVGGYLAGDAHTFVFVALDRPHAAHSGDMLDVQAGAGEATSGAGAIGGAIRFKTKNADDLLTENKGKLDNTIKNIDKTAANFSKLSDTLANANIGKTIKTLENTLATTEKMMKDLESGKGSAGKLLKDDALYNNLSGASKELELLLSDMKMNPKRYVHFSLFGKKPKPYEASSVAPK